MANTKKMDYVLLGLLSHEPMTGYEMKKKGRLPRKIPVPTGAKGYLILLQNMGKNR